MKAIKKNQRGVKNIIIMSFVCAAVLSACTKKRSYETLPPETKENDVDKNLIDTQAEYLYAASQQNASRSAEEAFAYHSTQSKRVKLELTKDTLRILELEKDERFASNTMNNKLVLEIPISHVQYACRKDASGSCTNVEVEDAKISWDKRDTVRVNFGNMKSGEAEMLPLMSSAGAGSGCYENISSRLIQSKVEKDAINFQIERVFKTRAECWSDEITHQSGLSDATVSAIYHYSLVKTSSALSKNYPVISYPVDSLDERTFGFFSSYRTRLDVDNNKTSKSKTQVMHRWNPDRKQIVYHLSDEFDKAENKPLKKLTEQAFANINKGLEQAGVQFRLELKNPSGKIPGDIRNSMIVLVEDPVSGGTIGYGPQVEDPVTGEIISARTVMFLGTIKKIVKQTYEEILQEKKKINLEPVFSLSSDVAHQVASLKSTGLVFGSSELVKGLNAAAGAASDKSTVNVKDSSQAQNAVRSLRDYTSRKNNEFSGRDLKSRIKYLHQVKNCAFTPNLDLAGGAISERLKAVFAKDAKPWNELSEDEKQKTIDMILPEIWAATLVHEIGHNLGLRHNFAGSEDKDNFYSAQELAALGAEHKMPFSSVMDYASDLKALKSLGQYDIAALRFGYARKVAVIEKDQEKLIEVPTTLDSLTKDLQSKGQSLKNFKYCTDEHAGASAGCKRFDLGTSYTEIAQNLIANYERGYSSRNFRHDKADFSHADDMGYFSRVQSIFKELRIMMEVVESYKYEYNLADDAKVWQEVPELKDLRQAALLGGSFLTQVVLTPDVHCALAAKSKPQEIVQVIPLADLDKNAMNCQSLTLEGYRVVGQAGQFLNSKKDPTNRSSDARQIDVRGIWLDKVAALQMLTARKIDIGAMDKHTDNFLNMPELREGILKAMKGLVENNVVNKVTFTMNDGRKQEFDISYDMNESQIVNQPEFWDYYSEEAKKRVAKTLSVNVSGKTPLKQIVASTLAQNAVDPNRLHTQDRVMKDIFSVYKLDAVVSAQVNENTKRVVIDGVQYVADAKNELATQSIELLTQVKVLDKMSRESLLWLYQAKVANKKLSDVRVDQQTPEMKFVFENVNTVTLQNYLLGVVKNEKFYTDQLQFLFAAN